jgi:hypothetical protein
MENKSAKLRDKNGEPFRPAARKKVWSWFFVTVGVGRREREGGRKREREP